MHSLNLIFKFTTRLSDRGKSWYVFNYTSDSSLKFLRLDESFPAPGDKSLDLMCVRGARGGGGRLRQMLAKKV